jgi:predicted dehydrogenase
MQRLRVGLLGAGLVAQAEHAYYLWEDRDRFDFVGLADASPAVRNAVGSRYGVPNLYPDLAGLLTCDIDAVIIAAPDAFHPEFAIAALDAGLHVLCEKPLALTLAGCDAIAAARDRSGSVVQVGYMKRHDPSYRLALDFLPASIDDIRLISVEVNDPDHEPFVAHLPMTWPDDITPPLREKARALLSEQLRQSAGRRLDEPAARALSNGFLSALVHDVAVVHGMLAHVGCELPAEADRGAIFDSGRGVELGFTIPGGGHVSMIHLNLPTVPDYNERITVYCTDRIVELTFPSPYLRHMPTRLSVRRGEGERGLVVSEHRANYEEAFREQLRAFHAAATGAAEVPTPVEQARRDIELLISAFRKALPCA